MLNTPDQSVKEDFSLKIDPHQLADIFAGTKTHEVRVFERDYQVGTVLRLLAYDRSSQAYTGQQAIVRITNITAPGNYGLPSNVGAMSIKLLSKVGV